MKPILDKIEDAKLFIAEMNAPKTTITVSGKVTTKVTRRPKL